MKHFFNEDCIKFAGKRIIDSSVDLLICDPPFQLGEASFAKHYNRKHENTIEGYREAPSDYNQFSFDWISQAYNALRKGGSLYAISGWTHLRHVLNAIADTPFEVVNHIIWKYNFGVWTKRKWVSSHYHILYCVKPPVKKAVFNGECNYLYTERDTTGNPNYKNREDVWIINKEYRPNQQKNMNKLPDALVAKMIKYSSNAGDLVGDFFLGNFTTAVMSQKLNRRCTGFEINPHAYNAGIEKLNNAENTLF